MKERGSEDQSSDSFPPLVLLAAQLWLFHSIYTGHWLQIRFAVELGIVSSRCCTGFVCSRISGRIIRKASIASIRNPIPLQTQTRRPNLQFSHLCTCRPSILSLDTGIYPSGVTSTHCSHLAPLGPLLGLVGVRASCGFVCGPLWCICGSFWRVTMAIFLVVHIHYRKEVGSSQCLSLVGVYRGMLRFGALGLVLIVSPSSKLGIKNRFFLLIPYSSRNIL